MKLEYALDIDASPDTVFGWIENPQQAMQWMSSVSGGEIVQEKAGKIGTTFRETVEENGRSTELQGTITDYRANELIAFHLEGIYNVVDVHYRLDASIGRTRVSVEADVRFKGVTRILMLLTGSLFKNKMHVQFQEEFSRLKELCERQR